MPKTTWLLAGAAIALIGAGAAVAQSAKPEPRDERRVERDVRVYRFEDGPQSFVIQRDGDREVRIERRRDQLADQTEPAPPEEGRVLRYRAREEKR